MKNNIKYPIASSTWGGEEISAINKVTESGLITMGENVLKFEEDFSTYIGSKYSVMVNSGSSANLLMVASLFYYKSSNLKPGDEVIVPSTSWATTYYPLQQYGLHVHFVDIDLETLNYDLHKLSEAVSDKTRVIMAVNLLGNPNDFNGIEEIIGDKNIILIEDNCESLGAELNNKMAGTFGLMGTFSTYFSHHISTVEGGVITTDSEELYHILLSLRSHGWTRSLPSDNLLTGKKSDNDFYESFKFVLPGYNVRPLEYSGAIGIEQLKKLPEMILQRRKNAALWVEEMSKYPFLKIQKEVGKSSWFGFSVIVMDDSKYSRDSIVGKLSNLGYAIRPIVAGNFVKNPVIKYFPSYEYGDLSCSDFVDRNGFFIGNHHYNIKEAIMRFGDIFKE